MRRFKWIDWNLQKIANHGLAAADVEAAFDRVLSLQERRDGSFEMFALMPTIQTDNRSPERRAKDEQIAAEPHLAPVPLPPDAPISPFESHLPRNRRQPVAVAGIVENGLVRPLDPSIKLPEHARVIIVASGNA